MHWLSINNLIPKNSTVLCTVLGSVDVYLWLSEGHHYGAIFILRCLFYCAHFIDSVRFYCLFTQLYLF